MILVTKFGHDFKNSLLKKNKKINTTILIINIIIKMGNKIYDDYVCV